MLSFETPATMRNAPSQPDRADHPENAIADIARRENSGKSPSSFCADGRAPTYSLRGRFASRHSFSVPEELVFAARDERASVQQPPRWHSAAIFIVMSTATIFAMCAMGRPGA